MQDTYAHADTERHYELCSLMPSGIYRAPTYVWHGIAISFI